MAASGVQQVIEDQVLIRPVRYGKYHEDLILILSDALRAVSEGAGTSKRRKDLADAISAKASQIPSTGEDA